MPNGSPNPASFSQRVYEYSVTVQERNGFMQPVITNYEHCAVANLFGGFADKFTYTLRPSTIPAQAEAAYYTNGSKVLILCINGETNNAYIIGALWDPTQKNSDIGVTQSNPPEDGTLGHHLLFTFNGLNGTIDKNGQFKVTFNGATDNYGKPLSSQDQKKVGAFLNMLMDGTMNLSCPQNMTLKSAGVLTGAATDHTVLGDTYITAEMQMLNNIANALQGIAQQVGQAGSILSALASNPTLAPVAPAGIQLSLAQTGLAQVQQLIQNFTSNKSKYLSKVNLSD
jgi:hypothetical protein